MRYAIGLPETASGGKQELLDVLATGERLGFDGAWVMDNPLRGVNSLDPLMTLAFAASSTERMRLGTAVVISALRTPVELASQLASIDQLSDGRLIVGVGLGAGTSSYPAFGISSENRARRFASGLQLIKDLWSQDEILHSDEFWSVDGSTSRPRPVQKPRPPIWIGGSHESALKRAVEMGDGWIGAGSSSLDEFAQQAASVNKWLDVSGVDRKSFTIAKRAYISVGEGEAPLERARAWFGAFYGRSEAADKYALVGGLSYCVDALHRIEAMGADLIILNAMFDHIEQFSLLSDALDIPGDSVK